MFLISVTYPVALKPFPGLIHDFQYLIILYMLYMEGKRLGDLIMYDDIR